MVSSVTRPSRKIHFDIERQQPIKQDGLAIIVPLRELVVLKTYQAGAAISMFRSSSGLWTCRMVLIATRA
jgi:hypothetical protein